jgi:catechol 2,3-dioxygenase
MPGPSQYGIAPPGFRLPPATRVGRVRLQIADLARSLEWYQRVLGFEARERRAGWAALAGPGSSDTLVELHERPGASPLPRRGRLGLYHFAILLPSRAALGAFVRHLSALGERAGMSDHFVSEAVYLSDPDGLGIEVYADRPRSAWRHDGGELVMATEPLDVAALVADADPEGWRGLPAGTTIGHVHLFVADLSAAAAFYHAGLGLDQTVWSYPGALFLSAGGYHHHLGTNTWAAGAPRAGDADARLLDWELVLPRQVDVAAALDSIEERGAPVRRDPSGGSAADPWGTTVRLRSNAE